MTLNRFSSFPMEPSTFIEEFLRQVRSKRTGILTLNGFYVLLTFLIGSFLAGTLLAYFFAEQVRDFWLGLLILFASVFVYLLHFCFLRQAYAPFSLDQAALLTEKKYPALDNALINAHQLQRHLADPEKDRDFSFSLIKEQLQLTEGLIQDIRPESVIDTRTEKRNRNVFLGTVISLLLVTLVLPDFISQGFKNWLSPAGKASLPVQALAGKPDAKAAAPSGNYAIEDLKLTYNFPAYTQLKPEVVSPSDGSIEVLPGTEVEVEGKVNLPVAGAELVWSARDNFSMQLADGHAFKTQILVKEQGFYQFRIKDSEGTKLLFPEKYPVALTKDQPPNIVIFIANPKPVYYSNGKVEMFYEAQDDFGIKEIDLVAYVNGKDFRQSVKRIKNREREDKGSYSWNLGEMPFDPGDEVQYFLEIKDNDNVQGPNIGQSETFTFTIFDSREEQENLIMLQEQLTEKLIAQLAPGLVIGAEAKSSLVDDMQWRNHLIASADDLIEIIGLAQTIQDRAKSLEFFPRPYFNLLANIITGLTKIREDQIDMINKIQNSVLKTTPVNYSAMPLEILNDRLIAHLETDILFLVRMTNRQKLDQVMDLENQLNALTESLREEFEKIKNKEAPANNQELTKKIEEIRDTLEKIMDQLARQTQSLPDEFLNPDAFKGLNMEQFTASLDNIMDLANRGKMDEAMEQLEKMMEDLQTLANQLDQAQSDMDELVDMKIMEQLDDSLEKIEKLKKQQEKLLEQTTDINQSLRETQSDLFEDSLTSVFDEIRKDIHQIQSILDGDRQYLADHPTMKSLQALLDKEIKVNQKIEGLSQDTVDSSLNSNLQENFQKLNKARKELTDLMIEMDSLRASVFQQFKQTLPQLLEKYDTLEELTELYDLNEFNNLFKNTYPEVFQWQNNIRTTPGKREDLGDRLDQDLREVTRLNSEISKKLGSMMRMIQNSSQSLLSKQNKEQMQKMAGEEKRMQEEAENLTRRFGQMNKQNPMITPELAAKMSRTGRYMQRAESNLKQHQVQKSIEAENRALKELQETQDMIQEIKEANSQMGRQASRSSPRKFGTGRSRDPRRGGSMRMQKEKVHLPSEDQYKVPGEFRDEILKAMKKSSPKNYERMIMEYYKELVK